MKRTSLLVAAGFSLLAACSNESLAPADLALGAEDGIDLVQDFDITSASVVDRAGIGASELPDSLKLTAEQKAQIDALHEAFRASVKADLDAVKAIEAEARAARKADKPRAEVEAILAKAKPIMERIRAAFAKLQADIWKLYTPAQQNWIKARGENGCRGEAPRLSEEQIKKIRELKDAFLASIKDEMEIIRKVHQEAKDARAAGKSAEEIKRILAKAAAAVEEVRKAELRLKEAINAVLTPEQRRNPCVLRGLNG
ncbi:MAG: Spy/CpxP family protein refolding chaperone [Gemmatimonadaceae bacterium]